MTRRLATSATRERHRTATRSPCPPMWPAPARLIGWSTPPATMPEASTAENTNKAYAADWKHFARWCRMKGTDPLPPSPEMIGLYLADLAARRYRATAPALSVSHDRAPPVRPRLELRAARASPSIARTATSPPCWPGSSASMRARRCRRKRSCPRTSSPWWPPCPTTCAGCGTGRSCCWATPAGCAGPRSSASIVHKDDTPDSGGWIEILEDGALLTLNAKTGWREVEIGARLQRTRPVPSTRWSNGCTLPGSTSARSSSRTRAMARRALRRTGSQRQACRPPDQANRPRRRASAPTCRKRTGSRCSPATACAPGLASSRRGRRALCPEATWPRLGRDDPPLPAPTRPVPGEPDQGRGVVIAINPPAGRRSDSGGHA